MEPTFDHTLARRGAIMLVPRANLRWADVDCRHWANEVNVDRQHPNISMLSGTSSWSSMGYQI